MTSTVRYKNAFGATNTFNVDLGTTAIRLGQVPGFTERAEHCAVGASSVVIDDPSGTVGNGTDAILGLQQFTWDENDMAAGNKRVYTGIIDARDYARGDATRPSLRTGIARQITVSMFDLNALLGFRVIPQTDTAAKRPAETVAARLSWILGSTYLTGLVANNGLVADASAFTMTTADYRGQRPSNVVNDCELAAGWFAFVYPDETQTVLASLFFDEANTSTAYTSTLRLTNADDQDPFFGFSSTTFAATNAVLKRSPQDVGDGVFLPYTKGAVYRTRAGTTATYGHRDLIASNANVSTSAKAIEEADDFLGMHHTEEDRITCTVDLPTTKVNLLRAGMRVQVKFSHLPGYTGYTWCRVLSRSPGQPVATQDRYVVALELSPQEPQCVVAPTMVQYVYTNEDGAPLQPLAPHWTNLLTLPAASTTNNLLVLAVLASASGTTIYTPDGWTREVNDEDPVVSSGNHQNCYVFWKISAGEQSVLVRSTAAGSIMRFLLIEYMGPANAVLNGAHVSNRHDNGGPGYAITPAIAYNAGVTLVMGICFMDGGPQSGDSLAVTGTGVVLDTPISSVVGNPYTPPFTGPHIAIATIKRDSDDASGTTIMYPSAGYWVFTFTGTEAWLVVGMTFTCS